MQTLWVIFVVYGNVTNVCCINRQYCSMCFEKITFCLIAAAVSYHSYLFTLKLIWQWVTFKHKYFLGFGCYILLLDKQEHVVSTINNYRCYFRNTELLFGSHIYPFCPLSIATLCFVNNVH